MNKKWKYVRDKVIGFKDLGYLGSANIIGSGISAIFWFYLASILETENYGEIHYFLGIAGIALLVSLIGASNTITVYTAKNVKIHSTLYLLSLIGGFLSFMIIVSIFQRIDAGLIIFGYIINELGLSYLLGKKLYSKYSKNVLIQKILTVAFGIGFYYFFGSEGIIYGLALSYIHFTIIVYRVFRESRINFSLLKTHKGFIANNYFENIVGGLRGQADKIIIAPLLGFAILGNYAFTMQVYSALMMFSYVVFRYTLPQDASGTPNPKLKKITLFISIGISAFGITILPLLVPYFFPKYMDSIGAIQITSIVVLPATISYFYISKFLSLEKSKLVLIGRIISLSTIVFGMIILSKIFGLYGAAIAFVLSSVTQTIFFIFAYKKIKVKG